MLYVVERYLPGLTDSELEPMFERLGKVSQELQAEGTPLRYLGSTIVPDDDACFCQFEAPSEQLVADANRRADAHFDRIVAGVSVLSAAEQKGEGA